MEAGERGRVKKDKDALAYLALKKRHPRRVSFFGGKTGILSAFLHFPPRVGGAGKCFVARDFGVRPPSALGSFDEPARVLLAYLSLNAKIPARCGDSCVGGKTGIRTLGRDKPTPVFKTGALNQLDHLSVCNGCYCSRKNLCGQTAVFC